VLAVKHEENALVAEVVHFSSDHAFNEKPLRWIVNPDLFTVHAVVQDHSECSRHADRHLFEIAMSVKTSADTLSCPLDIVDSLDIERYTSFPSNLQGH
jgi:hypothetical protein